MYLPCNIKLPYFKGKIKDNNIEYKNKYSFLLLDNKKLDNLLYMKVKSYPEFITNSILGGRTEDNLKFIFNNDIVIFILDYYKGGKNYYYLFLGINGDEINNNFLKDYHIDKEDLDIVDSIIKENGNNQALLIFGNNFFNSFNGGGFYWYSPIEYYVKWKNNIDNSFDVVLKESPYSYVYKNILNYLKRELKENNIKDISILNKEKFGNWRIEGIYLINTDDEFIPILDFNNKDFFFKMYYFFEKYLKEYIKINPLTQFDDKNEWKRFFGLDY